MSVTVLELSGTPAEIGAQHGETLREEIQQCVTLYQAVMGKSFADLTERAEHFRHLIDAFAPQLLVEIEHTAQAANVHINDLVLLNARSELMSVADGCTAIFQPDNKLLGQTWDWMQPLEDTFVILKITRADGHQLVTVTEPGMVGKIGFNSAGIGCTLNFLYSPGQHTGTPIHVLLRGVLESRSLADAIKRIENRSPGQTGNVIIGTDSGAGCNVELAGKAHSLRKLTGTPFIHTNHHLDHDISAGDLKENSVARYNKAQELAHHVTCAGSMQTLLSDTSDAQHAICAPYKPLLGSQIGTVCTIIMDLACHQMSVRKGPNPHAPFYTLVHI